MNIRNFCCGFLLLASLSASAQYDSSQRKVRHYIGIQSNQLFKQILNLSSTNTPINNPYLLTYSINNQNGWGLNFGLGYEYNELNDGDDLNKRENKINDLFCRFGVERKSYLGKRWLASWGLDFIIEHQKDFTSNISDFQGNKTTIETNNKVNTKGAGPRVSLSYMISNKIYIGTEATYYFKLSKESGETNTIIPQFQFDLNTGERIFTGSNTTTTETSNKSKGFQFNVPVALFLIVKF